MSRRPTSSAKKTSLSQYGLMDMDIPGTLPDNDDMDLSDGDMDFEAELAALEGGRPKRTRNKAPAANLDAMIAESLKDVPEDDDIASGDEDDPELLNELRALGLDDSEAPPSAPPRASRPAPAPPSQENSTVSILQERISNYELAEKNAKLKGETSRARRFSRGLKTLNDLLKQAKAGRPIKDEDIPPPVVSGAQKVNTPAEASDQPPVVPPRTLSLPTPPEEASLPQAPPSLPEAPPSLPEPSSPPPQLPTTSAATGVDEKVKGLQIIVGRQQDFKKAALSAKHAGDRLLALEYLKVAQQFDMVIDAYKSGTEMDLNELPTPEQIAHSFKTQNSENQGVPAAEPPPAATEVTSGLITASTVEEALNQRLAVYQDQESKAKEQGNSSKQRRMGRIVKQYQDAIKLHAAGRPLPLDELPTPPGFGPIPVGDKQVSQPPPRPAPDRPHQPTAHTSGSVKVGQATRAEKQLTFLLLRQKEFREAAIRAKKSGNIGEAKEYLRAANGFNSVIEAARGGLAVDLKSLPVPPKQKEMLENTFDVISADDCVPAPEGPPSISLNDSDVLQHLHQQLTSQLKLCLDNRAHCRASGNIADSNRFEQLALRCRQDLDVVSVAQRLNQNPPKFHYESKQFAVVKCNTDLNENDLELTVVRGIAYNVANPKDVDTYVKFEFPYPQETPVSDRTHLVKDTNSPAYNSVFVLPIQRGARPCLRVFKRHGIKFELFSRGGWFSRDTVIGSVTVKLAPLENHVTLHEAFPLMDGRRPAGGSLEIKLRVRTPLLQPEIDNSTHRWLCIDS